MRRDSSESMVVALNASAKPIEIAIKLPDASHDRLVDILNDGESFEVSGGRAKVSLQPQWARIMTMRM